MKTEQANKETTEAFKQELKDLLTKYNAFIQLNVGDELVIYGQTPGSGDYHRFVKVDGYTLSSSDLK